MRIRSPRRGAFTLVELLVVISILAALFALTAILVSTLAPSFKTNNGADLTAQWVVSARQMARRDGVPTGVRFTVGADNVCREVQYVRQPDDVALGVYAGCDGARTTATISGVPAGVDLTTLVQPNDYLELYGGGVVRRIRSVTASGGNYLVTVYGSAAGGVDLPDVSANPPVTGAQTNYRIIRQPRLIDGEAALALPEGVAIDFSAPTWTTTAPTPPTPLSNPPANEIVFGPGGQVIGQGTKSGMIYLWVRRARSVGNNRVDPDNSTDHLAGKPIIVTIYVRSGAVAQHPVSRRTDPFEFTRDGKASGM